MTVWYYQQSGIPAIEITKEGAAEQLSCEEDEATRRRPQVCDLSNCHRCALHVLALVHCALSLSICTDFPNHDFTTFPLFVFSSLHLSLLRLGLFTLHRYTTLTPVRFLYIKRS